ncbi:hypothetical protein JM79_2750 [Gramella sp. Hel_I_59]|uniref:hypothetical protein n=1 Tax=Gramella sp. Hel_I_59 TaxID=1249978 RepID=UPI00115442B9|nr:hypothetical protein [Gramella sp. Hel_I_59]TQI71801.1 hypothetical protein JM79_2750 [Gramella sp. Hel_I_59]
MNKKELKARCKELGIPTEGLTTNALLEEAIAKREAELEAKKAVTTSEDKPGGSDDTNTELEEVVTEVSKNDTEVAENVTEVSENETSGEEAEKAKEGTASSQEEEPLKGGSPEDSEEEQEAKRLVHEDKRGRKWGFKESAPKTLNIDGHPMSQEEIFDNEDVISELVYGNSSFLIQIHE